MLHHLRENLRFYLPVALLVGAVLAAAAQYVRPLPPRHVVMAAGPESGVYAATARRYRDKLQREGITLEIVTTRGAVENLELLRAEPRRVDVALIQGGVGASGEDEALEALGSVFYEPVFLFARRSLEARRLADLKGRRIAIGPPGSGNRALALQLLAENGFDTAAPTLLPLAGLEARTALLQGTIDAGLFVIAHPLPTLNDLFRSPELELVAFERADAYRMIFPFLSAVTLPAGAISLADDIPPRDVSLLAPAAALVVREDLHSAIKNLFVRVAREVHGGQQLFAPAGRFPSRELLDYPLNAYAQRFMESGPSIFARFLPFWVAVWGERALILMLPLLGVLLPLLRIGPPIYRWQIERKIYRWYRHLARIEREAAGALAPDDRLALVGRLDVLDARVSLVRVPLSYARQLHDLRQHIDLVRAHLDRAPVTSASPPNSAARS
ncbi:MAG: TAXI family TRAP transporter solute-binding subunit [Alphaproteobacteria bacterium]|nr:TAXI family TRAP transporter solute-binding subunit [Alphaproteobacteria bacterium]